jgi:3',5'-cyclic AMP phosphodiesterase CpdA
VIQTKIMKIQYCSDLHLEFKENETYLKSHPLIPEGEILVLAGDIIPLAIIDGHQDFLDFVSDNFEMVYWLPGNHEYYHHDIGGVGSSTNTQIRKNVFLVNNTQIEYKVETPVKLTTGGRLKLSS